MLKLFRRKPKVVEIPRDPPEGLYQGVWEKRRMPSPGAQAYSWETLSLAQFTPIGPAVNTRIGIQPLPGTPQPVALKAVTLDGVPTTAGQVIGQPLFDPSQGFVNSNIPYGNTPFPFSTEPQAGQVI